MRVLVVDDHPLMREILSAVVSQAFGRADITPAGTLEQALDRASKAGFDLVLLDLGLPGCARIGALTAFVARHPAARVVVVSAIEDADVIADSIAAGAAAYLCKTAQPDAIVARIKEIMGHAQPAAGDAARAAQPELSPRMREVLGLVLDGLSNRGIAARLAISENTVKHHLSAIFDALGASSRAQAIAAALKLGHRLRATE